MGRRNQRRDDEESGQSIVLLALVFVGLLAFAGLAVDGGRIYTERAHAQAGADAAVMAAVRALCAEEDPVAAAYALAALNGFNNDGSYDAVVVNRPPLTGSYAGDNKYVEVIIDANISGTFVTTVYNGPLKQTVRAVAYCVAGSPGAVGGGNAIISLHPSMRKGFWGTGNGEVIVSSGGIWVNSSNSRALESNGNGSITADTISIVGGWRKTGNGTISPAPTTGVSPMQDPLADVPPPPRPAGGCTSVQVSGNNPLILNPGVYCKIKATGNGDITMNPGIYYIEGGDFKATGNGDVVANEVMIYLDQGEFELTGNGDFTVTPPSSGDYKGMVLYLDRSNTSRVKITGNGDSSATGTMYAPASEFMLTGNGNNTVMNAQLIGSYFKTSGNGDLNVNYDANQLFQLQANALVGLAE